MKEFTLNVYNTITKKYEDVVVAEDVYRCYKRSYWNEDKQNQSEGVHCVPFVAIRHSGEDGESMDVDCIAVDTKTPVQIVEENEMCTTLANAINRLTEPSRTRLILKYYGKFSISEIAKMEGVSEHSIKDSLALAKEKLKNILKKYDF